tara:strand:- start:25 stop:336 length:312 start_codon:yes stop_codon:yes gene_type:complete
MRAARIEDGAVVDIWEVSSLTSYEGMTLIEVEDTVIMGASYDGTTFTNPTETFTAEEIQATTNAVSKAYLRSTDWYITRHAETAVAVPADVTTAREAAREAIV